MTSLRDAVQDALKKRRKIGVQKNGGPKRKFYYVKIEFDVIEKRSLRHMVQANTRDEAIKAANIAFSNTDALHLALRGETRNPRRYKIDDPAITSIKPASRVSLSSLQRTVLEQMYFDNLKLFSAGSYTNSRRLKKSENSQEGSANMVTSQTVDALYRKGLIIPESKLIKTENEAIIQKALGTLPSNSVLVVNRDIVAQYGLRLKDPNLPAKKVGIVR